LSLIRTLTDRIFKINNSWLGFHNDIKKLISLLRKNLFPEHIIDNCKTIDNSIAKALSVEQPSSNNTVNAEVSEASKRYYKLPYIGRFTIITQRKLSKLVNRYCKETNIKLVFATFKICNMLSVKDSIPKDLRSCVVYKFTCASCKACYIDRMQ